MNVFGARAVRIGAAAVALGFTLFAHASAAFAADKDDRSMAKAADALIQLFVGEPASAAAPQPERRVSHSSAQHTVHAADHVVVRHDATPAAVARVPARTIAQPVVTPVTAPQTPVAHHYVAPVVAQHVAERRVESHPGPRKTPDHPHKTATSDGDDWLKQ